VRAVLLSSVIAFALALAAAPARADGDSDDLVSRPLVLAPGQVDAAITIETNQSIAARWNPTSIAPDLWVGVTDRLTLGAVSSAHALSLVGAGNGWCFRGPDHNCRDTLSDLGLDARYLVADGPLAAAVRVRVVVRRFAPILPSLRLGALVRWQRGRFAITSDPQLELGLANTDQGNRAQLNLPIWFTVQPTCRWALYLRTGPRGELAIYGDAWGAPFMLGVRAAVTPRVEVAAEGGLLRLIGPLNENKLAAAWIGVDLRWP
jgi:hypothetical protein